MNDTCPYCHDDGRLCWECGALDAPSIGRKLVHLMHHDRPTLLRILAATDRRFWPLLAAAYCAAIGVTEAGQRVPAIGVVSLWGMLVREADANAHLRLQLPGVYEAADASAESYANL